ncbi:glycosyltransferase family 2 protein [Alteribacter keqinensis]|uniref:Glycosyltransferase family 2 protein n=1 Tax=Alteribacter keqinensis TaxID=2483800 RepID=A0A3M7TTB6_9BACI|nr:glycosyltransferase family 2 protein [Alteribacter keqinensis]RNA67593.1 glycosyltransferase family 2 protein [Alteribacter keqinensis]
MTSYKSKEGPLVSVITPAYNAERFIGQTIESVMAQSFQDWEMIIVDDCSTDQTLGIIEKFANRDGRIRATQLPTNSGAAVARNEAIKMSKGQYLAFLDSDDQWLPEKLEKQLDFMKEKGAAFSFTDYIFIDETGKETGEVTEVPECVSYKDLLKENMIGCLTVMIDREKTGCVEMIDIRTRQDYVLWLDLCKRGFKARGLQKPLSKYRVVEGSVSSNKIKMAKQNWKVYREVEKLNLVKSMWYFLNYLYFKVRKYSAL